MTQLIATDSPLYLRRLVRELNGLIDGFYYQGTRCNRARFTDSTLQVKPLGSGWHPDFRTVPAGTEFTDVYGRTVCASRRASK